MPLTSPLDEVLEAWQYARAGVVNEISHEEYHRGRIALYARMVGRAPALTLLIYASSRRVVCFGKA